MTTKSTTQSAPTEPKLTKLERRSLKIAALEARQREDLAVAKVRDILDTIRARMRAKSYDSAIESLDVARDHLVYLSNGPEPKS